MPKVLIVSERDLTPDLGGTVLWGPGVERLVASSPAAALESAPSFVPILVVVEASDGPAARVLIQRLRESAGTRRSSIVVIASSPATSEEDLRQAGADLILTPPVDVSAWDEALKKLLVVPRRVRTRLPARLRPRSRAPEGEWIDGVALDLSLGGMLIEGAAAPPPGETLDLVVALPDGRELHAMAEAVRLYPESSPVRVGLRFRTLELEAQEGIRGLLSTLTPDLSFGRYEVLGLLGEGSMGRVYRGFDPLAHRLVAIKTPKPHLIDGVTSEQYLARFRREAQAAARLVHPNIMTIFDVGHDYFVMELLEGRTLQLMLRERQRLEPEEACRLLTPVAEALDYAHGMGTIHRDIKPSNIMVLADGRPKIMDFGIAQLGSPTITPPGEFFGSPGYMAPEQITSRKVDAGTDLFSLAVVTYEALTGRRPFDGESVVPILYSVVHGDPAPPTRWHGALPAHYDEVFHRALAKDPADRFPSATDFLTALSGRPAITVPASSGEASGPSLAPSASLEETVDLRWSGRFFRRLEWRIAAGVVALGLAAAGTWQRWPGRAGGSPTGLEVSTVPPGATVFVDGAQAGQTPVSLTRLQDGAHTIKVAHEHYAPAEMRLEITGDRPPAPLRFTLWPLIALLRVDSEPPGATVNIDGQRVGTTPAADFQLLPGTHSVVLERPGFRTWARTVQVTPGESVRLDTRLERTGERLPTAEALRAMGWVRAGDLVELGPGVTPPRRVAGQAAPYPPAARRLHLQGSVTAEFIVTEAGAVVEPRIIESAGEVLDEAFLAALRAWRYEPADHNGVKVRVRLHESQTFLSGSR